MTQENKADAIVSSSRRSGDLLTVWVRGEVDMNNSPDFRSALLGLIASKPPKKLLLNLGEVPYMDSSAIAVMVEMLRKVKKIFLTGIQPRVRGILEIARLDQVFKFVADEKEALSL
jgi:anti-sigma B factor antagonist